MGSVTRDLPSPATWCAMPSGRGRGAGGVGPRCAVGVGLASGGRGGEGGPVGRPVLSGSRLGRSSFGRRGGRSPRAEVGVRALWVSRCGVWVGAASGGRGGGDSRPAGRPLSLLRPWSRGCGFHSLGDVVRDVLGRRARCGRRGSAVRGGTGLGLGGRGGGGGPCRASAAPPVLSESWRRRSSFGRRGGRCPRAEGEVRASWVRRAGCGWAWPREAGAVVLSGVRCPRGCRCGLHRLGGAVCDALEPKVR
ncbi:hypothetical protein SAMN04487981_106345 [Streptomyces sp. cf386]|nr:hypothetical protein SAMN04487981_106345 [Streptomyces sp. cf386]